MMIHRAMVLAAGLGLRLRPITLSTPHPLVGVAGRAMLDRALDHLAIAVHNRPPQISFGFKNGLRQPHTGS